jgi:hypothetical protein
LDSFFQTPKPEAFWCCVFDLVVFMCVCVCDLGQVHSFLVLFLVLVALLCFALLAANWF